MTPSTIIKANRLTNTKISIHKQAPWNVFSVRLLIVHIFDSVLFSPSTIIFLTYLRFRELNQHLSNSRPHRFPNDMNSFGSMQFESLDRSGGNKQAGHDDPICRETQKKSFNCAKSARFAIWKLCNAQFLFASHQCNVQCNLRDGYFCSWLCWCVNDRRSHAERKLHQCTFVRARISSFSRMRILSYFGRDFGECWGYEATEREGLGGCDRNRAQRRQHENGASVVRCFVVSICHLCNNFPLHSNQNFPPSTKNLNVNEQRIVSRKSHEKSSSFKVFIDVHEPTTNISLRWIKLAIIAPHRALTYTVGMLSLSTLGRIFVSIAFHMGKWATFCSVHQHCNGTNTLSTNDLHRFFVKVKNISRCIKATHSQSTMQVIQPPSPFRGR